MSRPPSLASLSGPSTPIQRTDISRLPASIPPRQQPKTDLGTHGHHPTAVRDLGAMEPVLLRRAPLPGRGDLAQADAFVEVHHPPFDPPARRHGTILAMGSSMMSDAPLSLRAGMRVLIVYFGTTASTAKASSPNNRDTVGAFMAGSS